jgi:superfamily II DNA or RNA helicase
MTIHNVTLEELEKLVKAGFTPKINTPSGFEEIVEVYRKNSPGYHLFFSDGTEFKAAKNHKILVNDEWEEVLDIPPGTKIGKKTLDLKIPLSTQDWIDFTVDAGHHSYYYNDMIHHNSGKSLIIYLIQQHYYRVYGHRTLIIVPTIGLVHQMAGDFIDYGCNPDDIHKIQGGVDKNTKKPTVISTWQSLIKQPKEWFDQFRVVLGDECHLYEAKSLQTIMTKLDEAYYRHGFTGTISSDSKSHRLILEGTFGPIRRFITTKNLIDQGTVANFNVKALILSYDNETKKAFAQALKKTDKTKRYAAERTFLFSNNKRNLFIRNLVWSLDKTNNLILFDQIENQGDVLKELLQKEGRILHYIHGGTPGDERERIRHLVENDPIKQHNILASSGTFSTGVNLKRLDCAIFTAAGKSEIRVLQSIGRTLRKGNGSDDAILYDIADDLSVGSFTNYTLKHFRTRIEMYSKEEFPFKIFNINL